MIVQNEHWYGQPRPASKLALRPRVRATYRFGRNGTGVPSILGRSFMKSYKDAMRSIELLSRAGEIAIAKRIEAGREAMIAGLCESPLTFQAIIIWRDELNEGKVFLRDIID